jgi:hypothetical protein
MLWAFGCNVYDPGLMEDGPAGVPDRPPASTSSSDDEGSLLFALEDIYIRQSAEMAGRTGLDLDGTATASRDEATCDPRVTEGGQAVVDGRRGIDNSLGTHLLPSVGSALPCLEDNLALTQGRGIGTVVLWIREWNGERNDAHVTATLTTAVAGTSEDSSLVGFRANDPLNLAYLEGNPFELVPGPAWDGGDTWYLDPADFEAAGSGEASLDLPKTPQDDAYVAFGRVVVPLVAGTEFRLIAGDGSVPSDGAMSVVVNGGVLMGDISVDHTRLERGLFAGRFSIEKLAEATPSIGMCDINATVIETLFGQFADIHGIPERDGAGAPCDAFSLGVTFNGIVGRIGGLAPSSRPRLEPCASSEPVETDRCCPSQWLQGRTRLETCDTPEKLAKAERFDALPSTVRIPVPEPAPLD